MVQSLAHNSRPDDGRQFLENFEGGERSLVTNTFLEPPRSGVKTVDAVLEAVGCDWRHRLRNARRWREPEREEQAWRVLDLLRQEPEQARAFAGWAIRWAALPVAERNKIKANRGGLHMYASMAMQPPSPRQIGYLRSLGHTGPVASKAEASRLIDELKRRGGAA